MTRLRLEDLSPAARDRLTKSLLSGKAAPPSADVKTPRKERDRGLPLRCPCGHVDYWPTIDTHAKKAGHEGRFEVLLP